MTCKHKRLPRSWWTHHLLTSTTAEAKTVSSEPTFTSLLNVVSVVDVPSPPALFVCSDVIKDVVSDATMNKAADHASVTTVVEEIMHEDGNKALESDIIANMAEDLVDEAVGQSGMENDDGHGADEEIGATANENMVEQYRIPPSIDRTQPWIEVFDTKFQM